MHASASQSASLLQRPPRNEPDSLPRMHAPVARSKVPSPLVSQGTGEQASSNAPHASRSSQGNAQVPPSAGGRQIEVMHSAERVHGWPRSIIPPPSGGGITQRPVLQRRPAPQST